MNKNKVTFMDTAILFSKLSKAKRRQVGAVLVTKTGLLIPGVNGTPKGAINTCEDDEGLTKDEVIHAELNCIIKAAKEGVSVEGSHIYVTTSPCMRCAALILQSGISEVTYKDLYNTTKPLVYLRNYGVKVNKYFPPVNIKEQNG